MDLKKHGEDILCWGCCISLIISAVITYFLLFRSGS